MRKKKNKDKLLARLFFNMLPVQILIFAMGSINSLVDGTMAGRFIGPSAVGVIGLYYSMVEIMSASGSVLLGGTAVLCGRFMGRGELDKTEGIFSLNLTVTFIIGAILTLVSILFPGPVAVALGANELLMADLKTYIVGYGLGILPMLFAQQLAAFLQMERQSLRGYLGIAGMIVTNVVSDILFVAVFGMGIWGLALATSLSNLVYFLILIPYYFTKKAQLHYSLGGILWQELGNMLKIGFPGAMLVFCIALRYIVVNRLLLRYSGEDGLSALSAFNMICGFYIAYALGNGSMVRMLISIFIGEEDKESMKKTLKLVFTKGMALSVVIGALAVVLTPVLTSVFFPDSTSNVYKLAYELFFIYGFCIPLILVCQVFTNYLQAAGHNLFVNIQSIFDGFFAMVIPALILAPIMGARGVWISNPIGIVITILLAPIYVCLYWKRFPRKLDEWMLIRPGFGVSDNDCLDISIRNTSEVSSTSEKVQQFCDEHGLGKRASFYSALCLEEMALNVVEHGFNADKKKHSLNAMAIYKGGDITLRIKDDCIPFNPVEMAEMTGKDGDDQGIGIRMVRGLSDDITYQNMLGLNVLTITVRQADIMKDETDDFLLEKRLKELSPDLHTRFKDTVFGVQKILSRYRLLFPEYTDHSELHSMTVIDSCNRIIGNRQIDKLNADEIYILLTACYLHDVGMGISGEDYEEFKDRLNAKEFFEKNKDATRADFVRTYHNEFAGFFIEKYADIFDIPSPEHTFAIRQVVRGHRKTDLWDSKEYPAEYRLPSGNTACLPYLAALIRMADEIDVAATRNPMILYDIDILTDEVEIVENKKVQAIRNIIMTENAFILSCSTDDEQIFNSLLAMVDKMQKTLDYCVEVVEKRTHFTISQKKVILKQI
jgi:Na+-driven multidrug efflux pump/anti-sigma regulatory factor (Ser/Thr protein kinase)